jgi:hypothetical protein
MAGESRTVLKSAGVEQSLIMAGKLKWVAAFFQSRFGHRFPGEMIVPGEDGDDGRSM